ncbi:MAG: oxidoreductase [Spirochaetaceae bacterium]|nr:MAG: oxidoreductase [Spirochaetaceae bacterium]
METATASRHSTTHTVQSVRDLTDSTYVLRMDRHNMSFSPGQYISLGVNDDINMREYSVYSGVDQDFLEVIVKEVDNGHVSKLLRRLKPGQSVRLDGPFGFFTIDPETRQNADFLFVATGTGISPFHCFALSYPELRYTLLHGVRTSEECYDNDVFPADRYTPCISRESSAHFNGRVTEYIRQNPVKPETKCYLCGNCDMIYEAFDILTDQGVPAENLFAEVYF